MTILRKHRILPLRKRSNVARPLTPPPTPPSPAALIAITKRDRATQEAAVDEILASRASITGSHGIIQKTIDKYQNRGFTCVTRPLLDYRLKLRTKGMRMLDIGNNVPVVEKPIEKPVETPAATREIILNEVNSNISPLTFEDSSSTTTDLNDDPTDSKSNEETTLVSKKKNGRPKKVDENAIKIHLRRIKYGITESSYRLMAAQKKARQNGKKSVVRGTVQSIIKDVEAELKLPAGTIKWENVVKRSQKKNPEGICHQKLSPLRDIEPLIVETLCAMSNVNEPLTRPDVMELADDIIRSTIHEDRLREFKEKRKIKIENEDESIVGVRWYSNFMKRWSTHLKRRKVKIRDTKRRTWCTKENFHNMYESVYQAMVDCGVAEKLEEETMFDREGKVVHNVEEMYGRATRYRMLKPERCIFVDETGCNTNQKDDGLNGGQLFVVPVDSVENGRSGVTTDLHFTVLPFISGTGAAVMCAIILQSEKDIREIPIKWKRGLDITKVKGGESTVDYFERSLEPDGAMGGGPHCRVNGIDVPTFICTSPKSSITTDLLIKMLEFMDSKGLYPRSGPNDAPFLLLDGHQSRTKFEFLNYINNPEHKWKVCIGVPYGTHIWQVADSSELNGSFKIAFSQTKMQYIKHRPPDQRIFKPTDIVPLVKKAWEKTYAREAIAKKAIVERGWYVLNYVLLDDPRLIGSIAAEETTTNSAELEGSEEGSEEESTIQDSRGNFDWRRVQFDWKMINADGAMFKSCLHKLMEEEAKAAGRKRVFEEQQQNRASKKQLIDVLEEKGNLKSGQLAVENHYVLDEELEEAYRIHKEKKRVECESKDAREVTRNENDEENLQIAGTKYKAKHTLKVKDMRALLKAIRTKCDSAIKIRLADITEQFKRKEIRVKLFLDPLYKPDKNEKSIDNEESIDNNGSNGNDWEGLDMLSDVMLADDGNMAMVASSAIATGVTIGTNSSTSISGNVCEVSRSTVAKRLVYDV